MDTRRMTFGGQWRALAVLAVVLAALVTTAGPPAPARAQPMSRTLTFEYTGAAQFWVVPAGVSRATFDVFGASGGGSNSENRGGGLGGRATTVLSFAPGTSIAIMVGEHGLSSDDGWRYHKRPPTFNGGGAGGAPAGSSWDGGGSGGGASDVRIGGTNLEHRVLVAGGGGGANVNSCPTIVEMAPHGGGAGGGEVGGVSPCPSFLPPGRDGTGGNQDGSSGSGLLGRGSDGADADANRSRGGGGGGGGGYYGGGGGRAREGGGGGSGYGHPGTIFQSGVWSGHGRVIITYSPDPPPSVTRIDPGSGPQTGGTVVRITGDDLTSPAGPTTVSFGDTPATAVSCSTRYQCTATSPPGTGMAQVRVTVDGRTSTQDISFFYSPVPILTAVGPNEGPPDGGTQVTLTGENFALGATYVNFGTAPATRPSCSSPTTCFATSPAGTGTVQVTVTTPFGTSHGVPFGYGSPPATPPADTAINPSGPLTAATCDGVPATIVIMASGLVTQGTSGPDVIVGTDGPDTVDGLGGDDLICGGSGDDAIDGGSGDDIIFGEAGDDSLAGGSDGDRLEGGAGADTLRGGSGDDTLVDREGANPTFDGGTGTNTCQGTATMIVNCQIRMP